LLSKRSPLVVISLSSRRRFDGGDRKAPFTASAATVPMTFEASEAELRYSHTKLSFEVQHDP